MEIIQKTSIILLIIINQVSYIIAFPSKQSMSNRSSTHSSSSGDHTAAIGASAHNNNNKPNSAAIGGAAIHNNQQTEQNATQTAPQTPAQNSSPAIAQSNLQQAAINQAPSVTTSNASQNINEGKNEIKKSDNNSHEVDSSKEINNAPLQTSKTETLNNETTEQKQAAEDLKTIPSDKDEILEQLKTIDLEDRKIHSLLNMDSMDQLFNNFVYFKNFIVKNFEKSKILRLAIEFINQIYPKENVPTITLNSINTSKHTPVVQDITHESTIHSDDIPSKEFEDQSNDFDQAAYDEYIASQAAEQYNQDQYNQSSED